MLNIAVFCSGSGTNLQAIIDTAQAGELGAELALVICDKEKAKARERARKAGIEEIFVDPKEFSSKTEYEAHIIMLLEKYDIGLVVLAGYMRILGDEFIGTFKDRIINVHPALLPSFTGAHGVRDALEYGVKVTGVTVHFVTKEVDCGPIILQESLEVNSGDTEDSLLERLHKIEHKLFPKAIRLFAEGKLKVNGRKVDIG